MNPLQALYQTTLECQACKQHGGTNLQMHRFETQLDLNLDIPSGEPNLSLETLIGRCFVSELIEEYHCIRCSLRAYLLDFTNSRKLDGDWKTDPSLSA